MEVVNSDDTLSAGGVVIIITDDAISAGVVVVATTKETLAVCAGKEVFIPEEAPGAVVDRLGSGAVVPSITFSVADITYDEMDHISKVYPAGTGENIMGHPYGGSLIENQKNENVAHCRTVNKSL